MVVTDVVNLSLVAGFVGSLGFLYGCAVLVRSWASRDLSKDKVKWRSTLVHIPPNKRARKDPGQEGTKGQMLETGIYPHTLRVPKHPDTGICSTCVSERLRATTSYR